MVRLVVGDVVNDITYMLFLGALCLSLGFFVVIAILNSFGH